MVIVRVKVFSTPLSCVTSEVLCNKQSNLLELWMCYFLTMKFSKLIDKACKSAHSMLYLGEQSW